MAGKMALMDWRAMKYYQIRGLLLPVIALMVGFVTSPLLVMPTCMLFFVFFSLNAFAVEEKGALHNLYLTLPVKRKDIVFGRFILAGIMGVGSVGVSIPVMLVINRFGSSKYFLPLSWYVFILAVSYLLFSLFNLVTYPILFKLGYNRGKFWGMVLPAIVMGVIYGVFTVFSGMTGNEMLLFDILEYAHEHMLFVSGGAALLATMLLACSIVISRCIYAKRDF